MKKHFLVYLFLQFFILDFLSQYTGEVNIKANPSENKKITFGLIPYELLGRKSSALLLFDGAKTSFGFGVSYIYRTEFDGSYLFPYMKDRFFYKGFVGDFLIGKSNSENTNNYFVVGFHYLYYDFASVTNGKVGDEVGSKSYKDGEKVGAHFSYLCQRTLDDRGNFRVFLKPTIYLSYFERTFTGNNYYKYNIPPQYQAKPEFQSGFSAEISIALGWT